MRKIYLIVGKVENLIIGSLLFLATLLLFTNVLLRRFGASTTWAEEAIRYAMIWITFIGCSACVRANLHVGIDIFISNASPSIKKVIIMVSEILSSLFCFVAGYYGIENTQLVIEMNQLSSAMMMPMWIVYIVVPIGLFLSGVNFILNAYLTLTDAKQEDEDVLDLSKHN